nr:integrase, catalytic region, zinc finger, CCHC-type, peptidase aspartic, catalytic [Tanacetum cinerariifolium]
IQKQLKKANTTLAQELKECKAILAETSKSLGESISVRDSCLVALQTKQAEFEKYKSFNDHTIECDKLEHELQCLYLHKVKECDCLAQKLSNRTESVSKEVHNELLKHFAKVEKHSISLEIALQKHKEQIIQLILFIVDSGCTKYMTGNLKPLCNFAKKFQGTVHFGNDQFAPILGYRDLVQGNVIINKVYYVEGLNYNLLLVGQFCDAELEVAFQKSTCFVRDLQGNDLLTDPKICMYALTVSTAEPKNIKEAMADSAWIEAVQEELHQFDRLQDSSFELTAFSDVDHAGCIDSHKSTSGGIQFLGDNHVDEDRTSILWLQLQQNSVVLTEYQLADIFTKALPEDMIKYLVRRIGMRCLAQAELEVLAKVSS